MFLVVNSILFITGDSSGNNQILWWMVAILNFKMAAIKIRLLHNFLDFAHTDMILVSRSRVLGMRNPMVTSKVLFR